MYPDRKTAEALLTEAEPHNPGPWGDHSRTAAHCAEAIAAACGLDADKAYVLGLLHDIGRGTVSGISATSWTAAAICSRWGTTRWLGSA